MARTTDTLSGEFLPFPVMIMTHWLSELLQDPMKLVIAAGVEVCVYP